MGINIHAGVSYLYSRYHSYKDFSGKRCLMLGVQTMDSDGFEVFCAAQKMGFELIPDVYKLSRRQMMNDFDSYKFFHWLGFDEVKALDYSDYEGAEILVDLNKPIDTRQIGKFDIVYNGGTLEHVYNVPQAMIDIGSLLKDEGIVIHDVPAANFSNHGFYTFSPTFFDDYYKANGYNVEQLYLFNHVEGCKQSEYRSVDCRMVDPRAFLANKLNTPGEVSLLVCTATRKPGSSDGKVPIQGFYSDAYADKEKLKQTADIIKNKYKKVAVYGTGVNACELYDLMKDEVEWVSLVVGNGGNTASPKYTAMSLKEAFDNSECIVIGSFHFADEIEMRIKDECSANNVDLVNMLDV